MKRSEKPRAAKNRKKCKGKTYNFQYNLNYSAVAKLGWYQHQENSYGLNTKFCKKTFFADRSIRPL